jgi:hypothetical protein
MEIIPREIFAKSIDPSRIMTYIRKTSGDISTSWIVEFIFTISQFQLQEFTIFNRQNLRIHDFNFVNLRFQRYEFTISASWIHNFNFIRATFSILPCWAFFRDSVSIYFMNSKCSVCWKRALTKLKLRIREDETGFHEVEMFPFRTRLNYNIILLLWELKSHKEIAKRDFPLSYKLPW